MARTGEAVALQPGTITELTNANVSGNITFQHISGGPTSVIGTTDAATPSLADFNGGLIYHYREGERAVTLDGIFPGASYVRVWAHAPTGAVFSVYHG